MIDPKEAHIQQQQTHVFTLGVFCFFMMALDFWLKLMMQDTPGFTFKNLIELKLIYNYSSILGFLSDMPAMFKRVGLAIIGFYFIFVCSAFLVSIWKSSFIHTKRAFLMIIFGASGNIIERALFGRVTDYITFPFFAPNIVLNIVDLLLISGIIYFFISQILEGKELFFENCKRSFNLLNSSFQKSVAKYCFFGSLFLSTTTYSLLLAVMSEPIYSGHLFKVCFFFGTVSFINSLLLTFLMLVLSQRSSGAIYAIVRDLLKLHGGEIDEIKLRKNDFHKDLVSRLNEIKGMMNDDN